MLENFGNEECKQEVKKLSKIELMDKYYAVVKKEHVAGIEKAFELMELDKNHLQSDEGFNFSEFMIHFLGHFEQYIAEEVLLELYKADIHDIDRLLGDTANAEYIDKIHGML